MSDKDKVYIEKREFVEKLNEAFTKIDPENSIEYKNISDKYSEFIRISCHGGPYTYIDVTGDSLEAIANEVARYQLKLASSASITNPTHRTIVEGWFE